MSTTSNTASNANSMSFLELGNSGKSAWWRYLVGLIVILVVYTMLSTVGFILILVIANGGKVPKMDDYGRAQGMDPFIDYVALNLSFILMILLTYLVMRFFLARPLSSLITPARTISVKRVAVGFMCWLLVNAGSALIGFLLFPESFKYSLESPQFFYYAPIVLLLTPIQCLGEELLFRGYMLQFIGKAIKSHWVLSTVNGLLFMLPHLMNPEMSGPDPIPIALSYALIGFFLSLVTLRTNSLEAAIGAHTANNLFGALIVNYEVSALQTRSVFLCTQIHPWCELACLAVLGSLFCYLTERIVRSKPAESVASQSS